LILAAFLDHLAAGLHQLLGLLDAQAGDDGAHLLDDVELLVAARLENDGELRLLLGRRRGGTARSHAGSERHRRRRRHAPLVFQHLGELGGLQNRQLREIVHDPSQISHSPRPSV
jgi:hypothetical protein